MVDEFEPFCKFVVLLDDGVLAHVGSVMLEPVVHVNVVVWADEVIVAVVPSDFLIVPVPPFAFSVIVFVFAVQEQFAPLHVGVVYPVEHVAVYVHMLLTTEALQLDIPFPATQLSHPIQYAMIPLSE